jgi:hypothetical protein
LIKSCWEEKKEFSVEKEKIVDWVCDYFKLKLG